MSRMLVVYYSFSRRTQDLAEEIALLTDSDLLPLIPKDPYSFDENTAAKRVRSEIQRGFCPALVSGYEPVDRYERIFIGTPNWFKAVAPPVLSFLRKHDLAGKTLIPFCTHGGGGFGDIERTIGVECPHSRVLNGIAVGEEVETQQVAAWLRGIGLL